ncbi:hypothetical protein [Homoserinibacter sp. GY 40078]|uniref:hypothetical protein n=1 Tax=Homoserinibacter sp. GY 40078 TaxID=2603275 RepID=UPI0011CC1E37|nr:hypothetical protein [Homoserinibacter sp. GY 40078]TXK19146.1 hypothetical protein FVQ89_04290 [Homoserinibacter sp. GY 40078]
MSAPTPPEPSRHPERVAGLFVAVTWAAVVFAVDGLLAVALDRDPIEFPVSPLYAVAALTLAMGAVYLGIVVTVPTRSPWLGTVGTVAAVYLVLVASAATVDVGLAFAQAQSPFVIAAALIAAGPPIGCWAYFARQNVRSDPRMRDS